MLQLKQHFPYRSIITSALSFLLIGSPCAWSQTDIYGQLDIGYGRGNGGKAERDGKFQQRDSAKNATLVGIRSTEQLNQDMKAYIELESKFSLEDGSTQGFNRSAFLGLAGNWGAVHLGRQRSVVNETLSQFDIGQEFAASYSSRNTSLYSFGFSMNGRDQSRSSSMISYYSPRVRGLRMAVGVVSKNDDIWNQGEQARNIYELGLEYQQNSFTLGTAFRSKPYKAVTLHPSINGAKKQQSMNSAWGIAAKYNFGQVELSGGYIDDHAKEVGKGYFIGTTFTPGPYKVGGQLVHNTFKGKDGKKPLAISLYGRYALSKRSSFYTLWGAINGDAKAVLEAEHKNSFGFGFTHRF